MRDLDGNVMETSLSLEIVRARRKKDIDLKIIWTFEYRGKVIVILKTSGELPVIVMDLKGGL